MTKNKTYQKIGARINTENNAEFCVWSPTSKQVTLNILRPFQDHIKLEKDIFGYWKTTVNNVGNSCEYVYRLDNRPPFPDPASCYQPKGVHGPSQVMDFTHFEWSDSSWKNIPLNKMIMYELHTGTFSKEGTFEGIERRLDYLLELGINTIQLMPVGQFPGKRNWGYDVAYPFAVQQSYGGPLRLMKLVDLCHSKGMAIILDVIYNHMGPEGNYLGEFAPYFTNRYQTPWGKAINFDDTYAYGVRNYVIKNVLMWLKDFHFDGLRLDAVHAIYDFSARHIMQEISEEVDVLNKKTGKEHYVIAESGLNDSCYINPINKGGYGLQAQWSDDFHHGLHTIVTNETNGYYEDFGNPEWFRKAYLNGYAYGGEYSAYKKSHFGNSSKDNQGKQFVVFSQNHDQVGNRKFGNRLSTQVSYDMQKVIAAAVFFSPYLPMLFMGEEYGEQNPFLYFVNHNDENLNRLVREGRQREFGSFFSVGSTPAPDPSDKNTFQQSLLKENPLDVKSAKILFQWYQNLIQLKKSHPVLSNANKFSMKVDRIDNLFILERWEKEDRIIAWINFGNQKTEVTLPDSFAKPASILLDSSDIMWSGTGSNTPKSLSQNQKVTISPESILSYSI